MTHIFQPKPEEMGKWRIQAGKAATHLKEAAIDKRWVKISFVFDDGVVAVEVDSENIRSMTAAELAEHIYQIVLTAAQVGGTA